MKKPINPAAPYLPAAYTNQDAYALQALAKGIANAGQQAHALDFIINNICKTYDLPYRPDSEGGDRDTSFASGKQFCGMQIVKLLKITFKASAQHKDNL